MKKISFALVLLVYSFASFAQDTEIEALIKNKQFDKIIAEYAPNADGLPTESLYFVGLAYYSKSDDKNCVEFMDKYIAKGAKKPEAFFYKAQSLYYMSKFEDAVKSFQAAIELKSDSFQVYIGLADAYEKLEKYDLALKAYQNALKFENCPPLVYNKIAQCHFDTGNKSDALKAYHKAKSEIPSDSKSYINTLYSIGMIEYLNGNMPKAESAWSELVEISPEDYMTYSKLVQVCYAQKEYDKAKPYKDILYAAHKKGELKGALRDKFCFDQFNWKNKKIMAFERYESGNKDKIYYKHIFYLLDEDGKTELSIQTEYSPFGVESGSGKYIMGMNEGDEHFTFPVGFKDDNIDYDTLKKCVIEILDGKIIPMSSSRKTKDGSEIKIKMDN